jgi:hypothetical protein
MTRIYQDVAGGWIYFDGTTKHQFATFQEASSMNRKSEFAKEYAAKVKTLIDTLDDLAALKAEFLALEYQTTMADADIEEVGFLVADLYAAAGAVDAIKATFAAGTNAKTLYTVGA